MPATHPNGFGIGKITRVTGFQKLTSHVFKMRNVPEMQTRPTILFPRCKNN